MSLKIGDGGRSVIALAIGGRVSESVDLSHRDPRQALVDRPSIVGVLSLQDPLGRRAAEIPVRFVHVGQQSYIGRRVTRRELGALILGRLHSTRFAMDRDQPRHLRPAQSRHPPDVLPHHALLGTAQACVLVPHQRPFHPVVDLGPLQTRKPNLATPRQERPDLLQAHCFRIVHADDQSPASRSRPPSGSSCMRIQAQLQAHLA